MNDEKGMTGAAGGIDDSLTVEGHSSGFDYDPKDENFAAAAYSIVVGSGGHAREYGEVHFAVKGKAMLQLFPDGRVLVFGRPAGSDADVVRGLREYLLGLGIGVPLPEERMKLADRLGDAERKIRILKLKLEKARAEQASIELKLTPFVRNAAKLDVLKAEAQLEAMSLTREEMSL